MHISNYIYHSALDFNIPLDMGGFGELYNISKYSRVNLIPANSETPALKSIQTKEGTYEAIYEIKKTAPDEPLKRASASI